MPVPRLTLQDLAFGLSLKEVRDEEAVRSGAADPSIGGERLSPDESGGLAEAQGSVAE